MTARFSVGGRQRARHQYGALRAVPTGRSGGER
jgi:hypothetical protein